MLKTPIHSVANVSMEATNASSFLKGTKNHTLILCHGFTGSPEDMLGLAKLIHKKFNINCLCLTLPGHEDQLKALSISTSEQWLDCLTHNIDYYLSKKHDIHLMGLSMGGTLSLIIQQRFSSKIKSLCLLAPALFVKSTFNDIKLLALTLLPKSWIPNKKILKNGLKGDGPYDYYILPAMVEYKKITLKAKKNLTQIDCPTFLCHSLDDDTIKPKSSDFIFKYIKHTLKPYLKLKNAGHIIPKVHGGEKELLEKELLKFYKKIL